MHFGRDGLGDRGKPQVSADGGHGVRSEHEQQDGRHHRPPTDARQADKHAGQRTGDGEDGIEVEGHGGDLV